jgi:hypothetical protein
MFSLEILRKFGVLVVLMMLAPTVFAEQYRFQDEQGEFVVSEHKPPAGVSYAVLDDQGVYQYLVHATAAELADLDWRQPGPVDVGEAERAVVELSQYQLPNPYDQD